MGGCGESGSTMKHRRPEPLPLGVFVNRWPLHGVHLALCVDYFGVRSINASSWTTAY